MSDANHRLSLELVRRALVLQPPAFDPHAARNRMTPTRRPLQRSSTAPGQPRQAATLILLFPVDEHLYFVLTRRREDLPDHAGQISLPGGSREKDESFEQTALRETQEEMGIKREAIELIGHLAELYIPPSDFQVHPFVGYTPKRPQWIIDEREVAEVIETPLHVLLDDSIKHTGMMNFRGLEFEIYWYDVQGHRVWGATAIMLAELEGRLRAILPA